MGVYIKGMSMPTGGRILIVFPSGRVLEVSADATQNIFRETQAVPVPPHGRLIDADALDVIGYCGIPQGREDTFDSGVMWLAERIDELPTIIPAEEGET